MVDTLSLSVQDALDERGVYLTLVFSNTLCRKAKSIGFKRTEHKIRVILSISDRWGYIRNEIGSGEAITKFCDYFESYWMKGDFYRTSKEVDATTIQYESFLLADYSHNGMRIMIFSLNVFDNV